MAVAEGGRLVMQRLCMRGTAKTYWSLPITLMFTYGSHIPALGVCARARLLGASAPWLAA